MVFFDGLNHGLNQWFKPIGLNQPTLNTHSIISLIYCVHCTYIHSIISLYHCVHCTYIHSKISLYHCVHCTCIHSFPVPLGHIKRKIFRIHRPCPNETLLLTETNHGNTLFGEKKINFLTENVSFRSLAIALGNLN